MQHDYLWRVHNETPQRGEIAVWNRSHYEDVLVVRVKNLVPTQRWQQRFRHIREFEKRLLDEQVHVVPLLWWHRVVPHNSRVRGWTITPSHYLNGQLDTIWLAPE